jgi:hypothetical protein
LELGRSYKSFEVHTGHMEFKGHSGEVLRGYEERVTGARGQIILGIRWQITFMLVFCRRWNLGVMKLGI